MLVAETAARPALADDDAPARRIDHEALQRAVADLLLALDADLGADGLRDTPRRVAEAYGELLTSPASEPTTFLCMHDLLPFRGVAHVGYVPGERIVGLRAVRSPTNAPAIVARA